LEVAFGKVAVVALDRDKIASVIKMQDSRGHRRVQHAITEARKPAEWQSYKAASFEDFLSFM